MECLFCQTTKSERSYYPRILFNNKNFEYEICSNCGLLYINPLPQVEDYEKMYPISYQAGVDKTLNNGVEKLIGLRYSYIKHYQLIDKYAPGKIMVDYGCGNGNFLFNASQNGYIMDGVEYNPELLLLMKNEFPDSSFFTPDQFFSDSKKYDVIRMSNVFEHLSNPRDIICKLQAKLNQSGILIIEGPIEENFNIAYIFRKFYFSFKSTFQKDWVFTTPPTHIFLSNALNQRQVFENNRFATLYYDVTEAEWPFPEKISFSQGLGYFVKGIIAKVSMQISKVNPRWGNTFIYVGKTK